MNNMFAVIFMLSMAVTYVTAIKCYQCQATGSVGNSCKAKRTAKSPLVDCTGVCADYSMPLSITDKTQVIYIRSCFPVSSGSLGCHDWGKYGIVCNCKGNKCNSGVLPSPTFPK